MRGVPGLRPDAGAPEAPKSAARLAAEAVFELPEQALPQVNPTQVVVRRARVFARAVAPASPDSAASAEDAANAVLKLDGPRVFRVDTPADTRASGAQQNGANPIGPAPAERVARNKRIAVDKRPGPMLQVYQAPPTHRLDAEVSPGSAQTLRPQALLEELACLEPVFESIRRAQSFSLVDRRLALEWQRLARHADAIQKQIDDQLAG